ncbi:MAG: C-GCAxxG-C-C family (seleno)protein [Smithellaceae bacterium]
MVDRKEIEKARRQAEEIYRDGQFLCAETVFLVANDFMGNPVPNEMVRLASGFPVGIGSAGCVCGALSGGVMALGIKYGRTYAGDRMPGMFETAKELHDRFVARRKCTCCRMLIKNFDLGSPEHIEQCLTITGEVTADVIELLGMSAK